MTDASMMKVYAPPNVSCLTESPKIQLPQEVGVGGCRSRNYETVSDETAKKNRVSSGLALLPIPQLQVEAGTNSNNGPFFGGAEQVFRAIASTVSELVRARPEIP